MAGAVSHRCGNQRSCSRRLIREHAAGGDGSAEEESREGRGRHDDEMTERKHPPGPIRPVQVLQLLSCSQLSVCLV